MDCKEIELLLGRLLCVQKIGRPRHLPMRLASEIFNNNSLKVDAIEEGPPGLYVASRNGANAMPSKVLDSM